MKRMLIGMIFIFFVPLFAPAQEKWEYLDFAIEFNVKGYYVEFNKEDTGYGKQFFWDESTQKPRKFKRPVDIFNMLGEMGYELVAIAERNAFPIGREIAYTFKRRKAS